jgi:hypothetical protein
MYLGQIVVCSSNGEAVFSVFLKKWLLGIKIAKMAKSRTKQAGSQCTLFKPLFCPNNGETLILHRTREQVQIPEENP